MNNSINFRAVEAELKKHRSEIPTEFSSFPILCNFVTEYMFDRYPDIGDDPSYINCGYCFIWAYLVWVLWPDRDNITFATTSGHVVIKYNGKYYDSENMGGTKRLKSINGFQCRDNKIVNHKWMCWYWARQGIQQKQLRALVNKFDKVTYNFIKRGQGWVNSYMNFMGHDELKKIPEVKA